MLFIVKRETNEILFRVDAWISDCIDRAAKFIAENGLEYQEQEITMMGDMVMWVA